MDRPSIPTVGTERELLLAHLDHARATFRWKCEGMSVEQLRATPTASSLSLAGLLKHAAFVEWWWFRTCLRGDPPHPVFVDVDWDLDPDWEFRTAADDDPTELFDLHDECTAAAREAVAACDTLDHVAAHRRHGRAVNLRWILLHMLDEVARHNGHADIIRESIDGAVGY